MEPGAGGGASASAEAGQETDVRAREARPVKSAGAVCGLMKAGSRHGGSYPDSTKCAGEPSDMQLIGRRYSSWQALLLGSPQAASNSDLTGARDDVSGEYSWLLVDEPRLVDSPEQLQRYDNQRRRVRGWEGESPTGRRREAGARWRTAPRRDGGGRRRSVA